MRMILKRRGSRTVLLSLWISGFHPSIAIAAKEEGEFKEKRVVGYPYAAVFSSSTMKDSGDTEMCNCGL